MERIQALEQQIRAYVINDDPDDRYFESHHDEWIALCVAMDTLGDTALALRHYEASGIGDTDGEKYLKLYGLLQAVTLQQDSIRQLYLTFIGDGSKPDLDSAWVQIRELRHLTVGHPVELKDKTGVKRCFIARISIASGSFMLQVRNESEQQNEFEYVNLKDLYERYKLEAIQHLESIYQAEQIKGY